MKEQLLNFFNIIINDEIVRSFLTAFLGGFIVYFFAIRQKKHDRINKVDDSLIERRMTLYKKAEEIVDILNEREIIPFYPKDCKVRKSNLNRNRIIYIHPLYTDVEKVKSFDKLIVSILNCSYLVNDELLKWVYLLHMYNENMIVLYEGISNEYNENLDVILSNYENENTKNILSNSIKIKYFRLLASYDIWLISHKISKAIKTFYSSPYKLKFKKKLFNFQLIGLEGFTHKLNARKYLYDDNNTVNKIIYKCLLCNEDCVLAGKCIDSEKAVHKNLVVRIKQFSLEKILTLAIYKAILFLLCMLGLVMGSIPAFGIYFVKIVLIDNRFILQGFTYGVIISSFFIIFLIGLSIIIKTVFYFRNNENYIRFPYFFILGILISIFTLVNYFGFINDTILGVFLTFLIIDGGFSLCGIIFRKITVENLAEKLLTLYKEINIKKD